MAPADAQGLHHLVSASPWAAAPLEDELVEVADRLVGGPDAALVADGTALVRQGRRSVGVKRQCCGRLGRKASCQVLVSLTLARAGVPVGLGLRLFLPGGWAADAGRRAAAGVPEAVAYRPKWRTTRGEIDRVPASGARFGCGLADAGYGKAAGFRAGPGERGLAYAVGMPPARKVYPADVTLAFPARKPTGRPRKHPAPSAASVAAAELIEAGRRRSAPSRRRTGTEGPLKAAFAALRVRVADGPAAAGGRHLPGDEAWPVGERRASGERRCHLSNLPADVALETLAALIKARWVCEQAHQQMKGELGLGHFEGRGWRGLHHHAILRQLAFALLQHLRLGGRSVDLWGGARAGPPPRPSLPAVRRRIMAALPRVLLRCPRCRRRFEHHLRP